LVTVDQMRSDLGDGESITERRIDSLRSLLAQAMERTRTLMFDLNPQLLHASGLTAAIRALATQLGKDGSFSATIDGDIGRLPAEFEALAYRIIREAVINANKHARCSHLQINLRIADGHLAGTITDNGVGFSPDHALTREDTRLHFGLRSAIERARIADGTLTITSAPGQGTTLQLRLPIPEANTSAVQSAPSACLPAPKGPPR
jgi:signal transduction histidine kinase